jgi:hypothetical protein
LIDPLNHICHVICHLKYQLYLQLGVLLQELVVVKALMWVLVSLASTSRKKEERVVHSVTNVLMVIVGTGNVPDLSAEPGGVQ